MGKFQVTNAQWQIVTGKYPTKLHETGENAPVESVSWNDCQGFLRKLAELEGLTDNSFRLPTEAEWEYACRAGTEARFYTGDSEDDLASARWFGKNSIRAHPVGHKTPNTWGLYDMHGNVWEWCQDWYDAYPNSDLTDPLGPTTGRCRVLRGGSYGFFDNNATKCRAANRSSDSPDDTYGTFGFRCVRGL